MALGKDLERKDAVEKVTGSAKYVEDLNMEPKLFARVKGSDIPHGKIVNIDTSEAEKVPGVKAIATGQEFPNTVGLYMVDRTFFAVEKVRFYGEPVAAVAANTPEAADKAASLIKVEYEEWEPVFDPREGMKEDAPIIHENLENYERAPVFYPKPNTNIANHFKARKGDIDQGFEEADYVMERNYHLPHMNHTTIETHKASVRWDPNGQLTVWSTAQSPSIVRKLLSKSLDKPMSEIRVISNYIGGGFGGKAGATLEGIAIPLAKKCPGHVIELVLSREEDIQSTYLRQAIYSRCKTGFTKDGRITALEYELIWDGGAYTEYGINIVRAAGYSSTGPYEIENVKTDSYCVYTNNPVGGPVRGFGMPESLFGLERQMDEIARQLNMDPLEIRQRNAMVNGSKTVTNQEVPVVGYKDCLEAAAKEIGWHEKPENKYRAKAIAGLVKAPAQPSNASSSAVVKLNEDGTAHLLVGATEMGQGMTTALGQIAAESLGISEDKIMVKLPDTDYSPYEWQTVASRTTYSVGKAIIKACEDAKRQLQYVASIALNIPEGELEVVGDKVRWTKDHSVNVDVKDVANSYMKPTGEGVYGPIIGRGQYVPDKLTNLDPETGEGKPGLFWTFGATAVEVEVDPETGAVDIIKMVTAMDAGKAVNPRMCHIQTNGGTIMGLSIAMYENIVLNQGQVTSNSFTDYKIASIENIPEIKPIIIENPEYDGPYGIRGVAEQPMIAAGPALANAVREALDVPIDRLPLSPELVLKAYREHKEQ